jgi:hypothetical protein
MLSLKNFIINNQEDCQTNSSIHNYNTRNKHHFIDQMSTYLVFKKAHFMLASKFSTLYYRVKILKNDNANFPAALRKYLHSHSFHSVDEYLYV